MVVLYHTPSENTTYFGAKEGYLPPYMWSGTPTCALVPLHVRWYLMSYPIPTTTRKPQTAQIRTNFYKNNKISIKITVKRPKIPGKRSVFGLLQRFIVFLKEFSQEFTKEFAEKFTKYYSKGTFYTKK